MLRLRESLCPPDKYDASKFPILVQSTKEQYAPWATQDLNGLTVRLPEIHGGAGKWFGVFVCDHLTHAVERYRRNEQKLRNQEREWQRKLV